jgi:hypothetical protein
VAATFALCTAPGTIIISPGTTTVSTSSTTLVLRSKDKKTMLIRRQWDMADCAAVAGALKVSPDVEAAECFQ